MNKRKELFSLHVTGGLLSLGKQRIFAGIYSQYPEKCGAMCNSSDHNRVIDEFYRRNGVDKTNVYTCVSICMCKPICLPEKKLSY